MTISASAWLDQFFELYYRHRPVSATFIGVHEHDGRLPDLSPHGIATQLAESLALVEQVEAGDVDAPASTWESIDVLLAHGFLDTQIWELSADGPLLSNPCLYTGEATFGIIALFLRDYSPLEERIDAAVQRMQAIPGFLAQGRENVSTCPAAWAERAIDECDGALTLLGDGLDILATRHVITRADFRTARDAALAAFREYRQHLTAVVAPAAHNEYGVGSEAFDLLLDLGHCLELEGADVIAYAEQRLADAREGLAELAAAIDPARSPASLLAELATEHPSVEQYYAAYQHEWDRARDFVIEQDLLHWPDYPITFEPIPDWTREAAPHLYFLFYRAPAPFDPHVTQRYLVTPIEPDMPADEQQRLLRSTNLSQIRLNHVIHHGGIGHHVQNWWAYRGESRIGRMAAVDCALRIATLCGGTMAEGWSCYTTALLAEQGYLTPLEELAEQQGLVRMAGRAIVDARLHRGELSFDEAVAFYRDEIGMPQHAARAEVIKNSMFPAAAMMYLLGTDMIFDLRRVMEARWGSGFSLRRFHDEFLAHGSIPVALIARLMKGEPVIFEEPVSLR